MKRITLLVGCAFLLFCTNAFQNRARLMREPSGHSVQNDISISPFHQELEKFTPDQLRRINSLTTAFENSTLEFQYDYIENLHDGRGFTAGRVGFCSGTGDMLILVEKYESLKSPNALTPFLTELRRLDQFEGKPEAADTSGLPGFEAAWKTASADPTFRWAQDFEVERIYWRPAFDISQSAGLVTALSFGEIYDTSIQHGNGNDPDGLPTLVKETNLKMKGSVAQGVNEQRWISAFMKIRVHHLQHAHDEATREVWADSVGRVKVYQKFLASHNIKLDGPLHFFVNGTHFTLP